MEYGNRKPAPRCIGVAGAPRGSRFKRRRDEFLRKPGRTEARKKSDYNVSWIPKFLASYFVRREALHAGKLFQNLIFKGPRSLGSPGKQNPAGFHFAVYCT
jgi:hypothetical protein